MPNTQCSAEPSPSMDIVSFFSHEWSDSWPAPKKKRGRNKKGKRKRKKNCKKMQENVQSLWQNSCIPKHGDVVRESREIVRGRESMCPPRIPKARSRRENGRLYDRWLCDDSRVAPGSLSLDASMLPCRAWPLSENKLINARCVGTAASPDVDYWPMSSLTTITDGDRLGKVQSHPRSHSNPLFDSCHLKI